LKQIAHHPKQHGREAHFASLEPFHRIKALIHKKHDERTRGIEISIVEDADITISIWNMAGQEEFHAFHDYMMPNLGDVVSLCSFLFVFNPSCKRMNMTCTTIKKHGRSFMKTSHIGFAS
jgi:hypothetical protein